VLGTAFGWPVRSTARRRGVLGLFAGYTAALLGVAGYVLRRRDA
jgi:hypothetical protein